MPSESNEASAGPANQGGKHVRALDGLRGIAILCVMLFHYISTIPTASESAVTRKISAFSSSLWTGVDSFFVLSGFLITGILLREKKGTGYFTNFYMRRLLRIFPLYYAALIVIFWVLPHFVAFDTPGVRRIYDSQGWLWAYSQDLCIMFHNHDYFDAEWLWVGQLWSLGVEEHFYLVWPFVVYASSRRGLFGVCVGLIVGSPLLRVVFLALHRDPAAIYTFPLSRTDDLAWGALLALVTQERSYESLLGWARWGLAGAAATVLAAVVISRKAFVWWHWTTLSFGFSALGIGCVALLVFALASKNRRLSKVLESRTLRWFGKYSYGAYIFHTPLEPLCLKIFPPERVTEWMSVLGYTGSRIVGLLGFAAGGIGLTMGLAVVSYHAFERPFLKLKRYFEYRASAPIAVVQP